MAQKIDVQEKSVLEYLSKSKFLIPMYQRPYTWEQDECNELWDDIENFFIENKDKDDESVKYFLGSIVLYDNNGKLNIIDGQQRTTTLSLLICALYDKASKQQSDEIKQLVSSLESCLWNPDPKSGKVDYNSFRLESEVISESDNEMLLSILSRTYKLCDEENMNKIIKKSKSNYEKNYLFFIQKSNEFAKNNPKLWEDFCLAVLYKCFVLPMECQGKDEDNKLDNALRIFNTLNNRGIPLSDADIFKGEIIKNKKSQDERKDFIDDWKDIESNIDIQFLFHQYMHIIRARNGEKDNVIGLRSFFMQKYKGILAEPETMKNIKELGEYCSGTYDNKLSHKALQFYEVLYDFPNDFWKYLDSAYYLYCKDKNIDFFKEIDKVLPKIVANLLVKFIDQPTISVIKPIIFNAYTSLYQSGNLDFNTDTKQILSNKKLFKEKFFEAKKLIPALITLNLIRKYPEQTFYDTSKWQIEHIHPQITRWRKNYTGWASKEEAKPYIESIGNKMWLEQKCNIEASNKYFDEKKDKYKKSKIWEAQKFSAEYPQDDWLQKDIEKRGEEIYQRLLKFFKENI